MAGEPFLWRSRIRFVDTDASGRIHHTALLRHAEAAEQEMLHAAGRRLESSAFGFPRVHVEADFESALLYDDPVEIAVWVERIGRTSYTLAFEVTTDGRRAGRAKFVIVCLDRATQKATPLPLDLIAVLEKHLRSS